MLPVIPCRSSFVQPPPVSPRSIKDLRAPATPLALLEIQPLSIVKRVLVPCCKAAGVHIHGASATTLCHWWWWRNFYSMSVTSYTPSQPWPNYPILLAHPLFHPYWHPHSTARKKRCRSELREGRDRIGRGVVESFGWGEWRWAFICMSWKDRKERWALRLEFGFLYVSVVSNGMYSFTIVLRWSYSFLLIIPSPSFSLRFQFPINWTLYWRSSFFQYND